MSSGIIILVPGTPYWWAVHTALDQMVENNTCDLDLEGEDSAHAAVTEAAVEVLGKFTEVLCALAEPVIGSVKPTVCDVTAKVTQI